MARSEEAVAKDLKKALRNVLNTHYDAVGGEERWKDSLRRLEGLSSGKELLLFACESANKALDVPHARLTKSVARLTPFLEEFENLLPKDLPVAA